MPALMRPNPVRANLQAGGNLYGTMAFEFFSPGLMAILAEAESYPQIRQKAVEIRLEYACLAYEGIAPLTVRRHLDTEKYHSL